jgi:hypothetical protein
MAIACPVWQSALFGAQQGVTLTIIRFVIRAAGTAKTDAGLNKYRQH